MQGLEAVKEHLLRRIESMRMIRQDLHDEQGSMFWDATTKIAAYHEVLDFISCMEICNGPVATPANGTERTGGSDREWLPPDLRD